MSGVTAPAYHVRRFWEKPERRVAESLLARGGLWNSFVIVGYPSTLLALVERASPALMQAFVALRSRLTTLWEAGAAAAVYAGLPSVDFSKAELTPSVATLGVLPVTGVEWNDLGDPGRVASVRRQIERPPAPQPRPLAVTSSL